MGDAEWAARPGNGFRIAGVASGSPAHPMLFILAMHVVNDIIAKVASEELAQLLAARNKAIRIC